MIFTDSLSFSSNGELLCTSTYDCNYLWSIDTGSLLKKIPHATAQGAYCYISPNNRFFASFNGILAEPNFGIDIFDIKRNRFIYDNNTSINAKLYKFTYDSKAVFYTDFYNILLIDFVDETENKYKIIPCNKGEFINTLYFNKLIDNCWFTELNIKKDKIYVCLYDVTTNSCVKEIIIPYLECPPNEILTGGKYLFLQTSGLLKIIDLENSEIKTIYQKEYIRRFNISYNGDWFILLKRKKVSVYDTKTLKNIYNLEIDDSAKLIAVDPVKKRLAIGFQEIPGYICVYYMISKQILKKFTN
jgi:hypothetical protein